MLPSYVATDLNTGGSRSRDSLTLLIVTIGYSVSSTSVPSVVVSSYVVVPMATVATRQPIGNDPSVLVRYTRQWVALVFTVAGLVTRTPCADGVTVSPVPVNEIGRAAW